MGSCAEAVESRQKYYFLHIRKTAGTSLFGYLLQCFSRDQTCPERSQRALAYEIPEEEFTEYLSQFTLIAGHYDTIARFFDEPRFTFTMLREPIARAESDYRHMLRDADDPYHDNVEGLSLREALEHPELETTLHNGQTRFLLSNAGEDYDALSDTERVERAFAYLMSLDFFGMTEHFATSLEMLAGFPGFVQPSHYPKLNAHPSPAPKTRDADFPYRALFDANRLDLELYRLAMNVFDHRVGAFLRGHGGLEDEAFVTGLYRSILGREPDPNGLVSFQAQMRSGLSRSELARRIMNSPESRNRLLGKFSSELDEKLLRDQSVVDASAVSAFVQGWISGRTQA